MPAKAKRKRSKLRFIDPLLVSSVEFSRMSGLSAGLIRGMVADGELPSRVIRGRRWILRSEAIQWLTKQVGQPRPAA
jgi:hypothetical protein